MSCNPTTLPQVDNYLGLKLDITQPPPRVLSPLRKETTLRTVLSVFLDDILESIALEMLEPLHLDATALPSTKSQNSELLPPTPEDRDSRSSSPTFPLHAATFPSRTPSPPTPVTVSIPLPRDVDQFYRLQVSCKGAPGLCLGSLKTKIVRGEKRVSLLSISRNMDWADVCLCSAVVGPTVRMADVGQEWPGALLYLPGGPDPKCKDTCYTLAKLVQHVLDHFLTWWMYESARVQEDSSTASLPVPVGPGVVSLDEVYLVALRRRHIALGVYEWMPEIEVRL
ncbi:hypothetical protein C8Q76DRAFT_751872 [Earliella scabrosa]|nr:hypothetical protein C8Q76DRAFT_751872 [Earliella scabrosa]